MGFTKNKEKKKVHYAMLNLKIIILIQIFIRNFDKQNLVNTNSNTNRHFIHVGLPIETEVFLLANSAKWREATNIICSLSGRRMCCELWTLREALEGKHWWTFVSETLWRWHSYFNSYEWIKIAKTWPIPYLLERHGEMQGWHGVKGLTLVHLEIVTFDFEVHTIVELSFRDCSKGETQKV